jgi:hypothetical protein
MARRERRAAAAWLAVGTAIALAAVAPVAASADERLPVQRLPDSKVSRVGESPPVRGGLRARVIELRSTHPKRLRKQKARAARRLERGEGERSRTGTGPPRGDRAAPATVFGGLNEFGLDADGATPPDSTGAIGPADYVEMVNTTVGVYDRADLSLDDSTDLDAFLGVPGEFVSDPQIQWDPESGRWLYLAVVVAPGDDRLAFGWSKDDTDPDPLPFGSAGWCQFTVANSGDELEDYPKLGHNDNHILFGTNVFDDSGGPNQDDFLTARIWAIAKPPSSDDSCAVPAAFRSGTAGTPLLDASGDLAATPVPANTFEASSNGYVAAADDPTEVANANEITAWHVSGPAGTPALTQDGGVAIEPFDVPASVPQPGTNRVLDSLDGRLTQAVARTDPAAGEQALWTQHTVNSSSGRSVVRWYELLPGHAPDPTLRQHGSITDASQFVFNGAISPSAGGASAVADYNLGGSSLLAQIRTRSRESTTPLNQLGGGTTLGTSLANAADDSCFFGTSCRWGDYAGASPDPANPSVAWGSNQVLGLHSGVFDPAWRTRNFALLPDATAPTTTIDSGPTEGSTIADPSPTFGFTSDDSGSTFQCRVDGGGFSACGSPTTVGALADGGHSFEVRATGGGGMVDPSPAARSFTVDTSPPETQITKGPKKKVKTKKKKAKAKFSFTATEASDVAGSGDPEFTFECELGSKGFEPCTSPDRFKVRAKRKVKKHKFRVRATDQRGSTDPTPAKRSWKVKRKR